MSIRNKVALFVSLLIMGLILLISLVSENHMESHLKEMVRAQQMETAAQLAAEIGEQLRFRQSLLQNGASAFPVAALQRPQEVQRWLDDRIVFKSLYDHLIVTDAQGRALADWPHITGRSGYDYSQRDWFRNTLAGNAGIFSKPRIGQFVRKPIVVVTAPLRDARGEVTGVLAGLIDLTSPILLGTLSHSRLGKSGYLQIVTADRIIVADPDPAKILRDAPAPGINPALDRALSGAEGSAEGPGRNGRGMLFGFKRIQPTGWLLVAAFSEAEALAPVRQLRLIYWSGTLLFMVLAAGLVSWLVGALLRPLSQLRKSMDTLRPDEVALLPALPEQGSSELASIARSFNRMADTIRQRTADLVDNEKKLREITTSLGFGVYVLDTQGRLTFLNPAAETMLGWPQQEALGHDAHALFHHHRLDGSPYPTEECPVHQAITSGEPVHLKQDWLIHRDGTPFTVEIYATPLTRDGKPAGAVAAFQDISSRLWAENRIQRQATQDGLTGLVNRRLFMDRLSQAIYLAQRNRQTLVLLMLDLDGFKQVNDSRGHAGGDQLLRQVARRLTQLLRQSDTVARMGGDEFAMLLPDSDAESGLRVAQKILDAVAQPFTVDDIPCQIGVSIGMAIYPHDAAQAESLLVAADSALYLSKADGKHCVRRAMPVVADSAGAEQLRRRPLIEWSDDYLIGISPIDEQHQALANRINAIEDALVNGADNVTLAKQCQLLSQQARQHFAAEEALMAAYRLPDMGAHKIAHHVLLAGIESFRGELLGSSPYLALPQMRDWLLEHIQNEDMQLAQALGKHDFKPSEPDRAAR